MDAIPSNHRLAERKLIKLIEDGEWKIMPDGTIWRLKQRIGNRHTRTSYLIECEPRRVEKRLPSGYLMVRAMRNNKRVVGLAHRLVWQHFFGDIPPGRTINHKNGLRDDNRPTNLETNTYSDQQRHANKSGLRDQHGEKNPAKKLTDNQVAQIRLAYDQGGYTMAELGERFGVSFQHISKIVRGQRRSKQGGPTEDSDRRHCVSSRDPITGRFIKSAAGALLDGREHREFPEVRA